MTRIATKARQKKLPKANSNNPKTQQAPKKITTKTKDGWEMSAREALQVDFVVNEI